MAGRSLYVPGSVHHAVPVNTRASIRPHLIMSKHGDIFAPGVCVMGACAVVVALLLR